MTQVRLLSYFLISQSWGKVDNFGTFPGSDFPPKKVFWESLSISGLVPSVVRVPGSWHWAREGQIPGHLAHRVGESEKGLGLKP